MARNGVSQKRQELIDKEIIYIRAVGYIYNGYPKWFREEFNNKPIEERIGWYEEQFKMARFDGIDVDFILQESR